MSNCLERNKRKPETKTRHLVHKFCAFMNNFFEEKVELRKSSHSVKKKKRSFAVKKGTKFVTKTRGGVCFFQATTLYSMRHN